MPSKLLTEATDDMQVPRVCLAPAACSHVLQAPLSRRQARLSTKREGWLAARKRLRNEVAM